MVLQLLPASAKAFAERSGPNVVLGTQAEPWLTQTLKRVNKQKRPLNNVSQHKKCLEEILAGKEAIWSLASIILPNAPASELRENEDKMAEAIANYQMIHVEGYVIHVDMVHQHEIAYKLTQDSIDSLVEYHKDIFSVNTAATYTYDWPEKQRHVQKLQEEFVQAINRYVFRTEKLALDGMEEEGTGELMGGRSMKVREAIDDLFKPLTPPPPKIIDVMGPPMGWWQSQYVFGGYQYQYAQQYAQPYASYQQPQQYYARPAEPWRVLGSSTPSPAPSHHSEIQQSTPWSQESQPAYTQTHLPSPTPSYSQPYSSSSQYESQPAYASPTPLPVSTSLLPLPSQIASQLCSTTASSNYGFYGAYNDMPLTPQYAF